MKLPLLASLISFAAIVFDPSEGRAQLPPPDPLAPVTVPLFGGRSVKIVKCYPRGLMRAYCVSFDDGRLLSDKPIIESLRKRNLPATFFLNSLHPQSADAVAKPAEYQGFEVASHGAHHIGLGKMPLDKAREELTQDQKILGDRFHCRIEGFAYPYGDIPKDPESLARLEELLTSLGFIYARGTMATNAFRPPDNFLRWNPDCGLGNDSLQHLDKYLKLPADDSVRVLMEFAHSIDFLRGTIRRDLWEQYIDRIAQDSTIWKQTYLGFARYITALRSLQISGKGISNPSPFPVWVKLDGKPVEIAAGQTRPL